MKPLDPRLLRYSRSSRGFIFAEVILAGLNALLIILQSAAIADLVCRIFESHATVSQLRNRFFLVLTFFTLRGLLSIAAEYLAAYSSTRMRNELRFGLLDKILDGRSRAIFKEGPATISLLATRGIDNLDSYFSRFLPQLFIAAIVPLAVGLTITEKDLTSGVIVLFTVPLIPLFGILIGRFTGTATEKRWQTMSLLSGYFLDLLSGLATLKVFGRSRKQEDRLEEVGERYRAETMKVLKVSFLSSLALEVIATLSVALIAVSIGLRLVNGGLSLRTGLFILVLSPEVYWPIRQVALFFHAAADGVEAANRIFAILEEPEIVGVEVIETVSEIEWDQLTVEFPGREKLLIPSGRINAGQVNLITGPSGAGKSTFLSIILGFNDNFTGQVRIRSEQNEREIRTLAPTQWRQQISWLPQEVNFPAATVREVLLQGEASASDYELVQQLSRVGLVPSDLPSGLDTKLGTITETLSVGQKRKIALARALLKPASILILDEPSASVDDVSEADIEQAITEEIQRGKIVVLVSHRANLMSGENANAFELRV